MPSEIDAIDRKIIQLEIERQSLKKETDKTAKERRDKIEKELAELKSSRDQMKMHWSSEKDIINKIQNTKKSDRGFKNRRGQCPARRESREGSGDSLRQTCCFR